LADFDDLELEEDFDDLDSEEETKKAKTPRGKGTAKAKPKGIGASAVAEKLGANPKTFRAWLRRKVSSGDLKVADREAKARYTWTNWKDPELVAVMKAWGQDSHERGGKKAEGKTKTAAKKAPAKKTATRKRRAKA
jgi:hypothetical protein